MRTTARFSVDARAGDISRWRISQVKISFDFSVVALIIPDLLSSGLSFSHHAREYVLFAEPIRRGLLPGCLRASCNG
jgi:hypothetical protein